MCSNQLDTWQCPALMAAHWVGQKSGPNPILRLLWTKVNRITFACAGVSVCSLQRRFPIDDVLLRSGDIRVQVAKLCKIAPKF